jgi:hypothetical protein
MEEPLWKAILIVAVSTGMPILTLILIVVISGLIGWLLGKPKKPR